MKLCRFQPPDGTPSVGLINREGFVQNLTAAGVADLASLAESDRAVERLVELGRRNLPEWPLDRVKLLPPVERQEVWAAGVTYLRSKKARMEESNFSASAYDHVYEASRPELFFKSLPEKVVTDGQAVGIRSDAKWNVPEPELAFLINSRGRIFGFAIGNDMSSRDIEGENLLYLPQAKIYDRSCALGSIITVGVEEATVRTWTIGVEIQRLGTSVFAGETLIGNMKRSFAELVEYLFRSQTFPHGAVLLTGTGVVPPDGFTLESDDRITIQVSGIGKLTNPVIKV